MFAEHHISEIVCANRTKTQTKPNPTQSNYSVWYDHLVQILQSEMAENLRTTKRDENLAGLGIPDLPEVGLVISITG